MTDLRIHYIECHDVHVDSGEWRLLNTSGAVVKGRYGHVSVYDDVTNSTFIYAGYHDGTTDNTYQISKYLYKLNMADFRWYVRCGIYYMYIIIVS